MMAKLSLTVYGLLIFCGRPVGRMEWTRWLVEEGEDKPLKEHVTATFGFLQTTLHIPLIYPSTSI